MNEDAKLKRDINERKSDQGWEFLQFWQVVGNILCLFQFQADRWTGNMVIDSLVLKERFQSDVNECVKKKDWRKILLLSQKYDLNIRSETLWTFPTEYCLNFLKALFKSFNITNILSIGCGSGLLEFVLRESMGS